MHAAAAAAAGGATTKNGDAVSLPRIKAVLFDLDGTLLDTEALSTFG